MSAQWYYFSPSGGLTGLQSPPPGSRPLLMATEWLLPPLISDLHKNFHAWNVAGLSPGVIVPERIWLQTDGSLAFSFTGDEAPRPQSPVGACAGLAAWLVLLDKWMETFVVIARARSVWTVSELAGALSFTSPALLPEPVLSLQPNNWERVARALAAAVADGPMTAEPQNRHWARQER